MLIVVLLSSALVTTYGISRLPVAAIVRSRWRERYFLAWAAGDLALIAAIVARTAARAARCARSSSCR